MPFFRSVPEPMYMPGRAPSFSYSKIYTPHAAYSGMAWDSCLIKAIVGREYRSVL